MIRGTFRRTLVKLQTSNPLSEFIDHAQQQKGFGMPDHSGAAEGMSLATAEAPSTNRLRNSNFIDKITFLAKGGRGGTGGIYWYRFKNRPDGGPAGGKGGAGGAVAAQCSDTYPDLSHLVNQQYIVDDPDNEQGDVGICQAGNGTNGDCSNMFGNAGHDVVLPVPPGTVIIDADTNTELVVMNWPGEKFELARGGKGGQGNENLKTSTIRSPDYAEIGYQGEGKMYTLEYRSIADIALIGTGNSGKSSLLGAMSRTAPRPSPFAHTTWKPMIGQVHPDEKTTFSMIDLPSISFGSYLGIAGKDNAFLMHATRVVGVVYVIECISIRPFKEQLSKLQEELNYYDEVISSKAMAVVITKMDIAVCPFTGDDTFELVKKFQKEINLPVFPVSAHSKKGVLDFSLYLSKIMNKYRENKTKEDQVRRRMLNVGNSAFQDMRVAEARQVSIQRMQDFHMSIAIQEIMKERIRSRPNQKDLASAGIEFAKEAATNPDAKPTDHHSQDGVVYLEGMEEVNAEPFILTRDLDDMPTCTPEDWNVGGTEDLQDDIRTEPLKDVWPQHVFDIDLLDDQQREKNRDIGEAASVLGQSYNESERSEYAKEMIGDMGHPKPDVDKIKLAERNAERNEVKKESVERGSLFEPPFYSNLPTIESDAYIPGTDNTLPSGIPQTKYISEPPKKHPSNYDLMNSKPLQPEKLHIDEMWGSRFPKESLPVSEVQKALRKELENPSETLSPWKQRDYWMGQTGAQIGTPLRGTDQVKEIKGNFTPLKAVTQPARHVWSQTVLPCDDEYEGETTSSSKFIEQLKEKQFKPNPDDDNNNNNNEPKD
eukprot:TRINITY_DN3548_c0_g1_i1.p1 TRINITY_DN3548_c0_g1~~TRINITY_DN3548_c0_g1_i1.p1  ORF type:complete len:823 (+),score=162.27 TRINITY_DN3548_c0_g1_i1:75-2543(+)